MFISVLKKIGMLAFAAVVLFAFSSCEEEAMTTPSGHAFELLSNSGGPTAQVGDFVVYHEVIKKNDTLLLDTRQINAAREAELPDTAFFEGGPIPALYEAMFMVPAGDSARVIQEMSFFDPIPRGYKATDQLVHTIFMTSIQPKAEFQAEQEQKVAEMSVKRGEVFESTAGLIEQYNAGSLELTTTESGLKYIIHEEGTGAPVAVGSKAEVYYAGFLTDGSSFDNSYDRAQSFVVNPVGQGRVIKGWDEGLTYLKEGAKATFFIPSDLGYGEQGSPPKIGPNAELVFHVEIIKVD